MKKIGALILVVCIGLLLAWKFFSPGTTPYASKSNQKRWAALARGTVDVPGGLIQISAARDGVIESVEVHEGQPVKQGETLATQDRRASQLAIDAATSELSAAEAAIPLSQVQITAAEREAHRIENLAASHLATAQELDQVRDTVAEIRARLVPQQAAIATNRIKLESAKYEDSLRTIRSPVDGVIVRQMIQPGETINSVTFSPIFSIAPDARRIVRAEVEEDSLAQIKVGQKAEVVAENRKAAPVAAKVQRIGLVFGPVKTTVDEPSQRQDRHIVECILTLESDSTLLLGQRVLVRFLSANEDTRSRK